MIALLKSFFLVAVLLGVTSATAFFDKGHFFVGYFNLLSAFVAGVFLFGVSEKGEK